MTILTSLLCLQLAHGLACYSSNSNDTTLKVQIVAVGYPSGRTISYNIKNDSLFVANANNGFGLDSISLMSSEIELIRKGILNAQIDTMVKEYVNPLIKDGNALYLRIDRNGYEKSIYVSNVYLSELDKVISPVNQILKNRGLGRFYINYKGDISERNVD